MANVKAFDPYHRWLGIAPGERPASHYRLLGIRDFEADAAVISSAADRQMAHVKSFQNGPHRAATQQILNELAKARGCLLSAERKREYDLALRRESTPPLAPPMTAPYAEMLDGPQVRIDDPEPEWTVPEVTRRRSKYKPASGSGAAWMIFGITVLICAGLVALLTSMPERKIASPAGEPKHSKVEDRSRQEEAPAPRHKAGPGVVRIAEQSVVRINTGNGTFGSGVVIDSAEGLILTNYHVIAGQRSVKCTVFQNRAFDALGYTAIDPHCDLCLLKVPPLGDVPAIKIATKLPERGETVFAFGTPHGLPSVSMGVLSGVWTGKQVRDLLNAHTYERLGYSLDATWVQHSAPISQGNSGGPLINSNAELIGLNTWTRTDAQNLNFAIALPDIKRLIDERGNELIGFLNLPNPWRDTDEQQNVPPVHLERQDETAPKPAAEKPGEPSADAPALLMPLETPFPSGRVYSAGLFDVDLSALDPKDKNLIVLKHGNGQIYALASHYKDRLHGLSIGKHDNGKPMVFANYYYGKRHGLVETWNSDGEPVIFGEYRMGRKSGFVCFFDKGTLRLLLEYKFDELRTVRVVDGSHATAQYDSVDDIPADSEAAMLWPKYMTTDDEVFQNELSFKKQVDKTYEQWQKAISIQNGLKARNNILNDIARQAAEDEAATRQFIRNLNETFRPRIYPIPESAIPKSKAP